MSHPGLDTAALFDQRAVLATLAVASGDKVLDVACGRGGWAQLLARQAGPAGRVLAFDRRLDNARETAARLATAPGQVLVWQGDAGNAWPLPTSCLDLCLLSMVLHHLAGHGGAESALAEAHRVLKPGGRLAVMEFEAVPPPPGPPLATRLPRGRTGQWLRVAGFQIDQMARIERHVYMVTARRMGPGL